MVLFNSSRIMLLSAFFAVGALAIPNEVKPVTDIAMINKRGLGGVIPTVLNERGTPVEAEDDGAEADEAADPIPTPPTPAVGNKAISAEDQPGKQDVPSDDADEPASAAESDKGSFGSTLMPFSATAGLVLVAFGASWA